MKNLRREKTILRKTYFKSKLKLFYERKRYLITDDILNFLDPEPEASLIYINDSIANEYIDDNENNSKSYRIKILRLSIVERF